MCVDEVIYVVGYIHIGCDDNPPHHIHACMQLRKLKERMKEVMGQVQQVERRMEDVRGYKSKVRCCPVCSMTVNILLVLQLGSDAVSCPGSFVVNHWAVRGGRPGAFHTLCGKQMAHCCCPSGLSCSLPHCR